jgi:hypothetical protein
MTSNHGVSERLLSGNRLIRSEGRLLAVIRHRMAERQAEHAPPICGSALGEIHSFGTALAGAQLPKHICTAVRQARK